MGIGFYLQFGFAQHALEAAFLVAVSCGLIGPFVITRTMSFAVHGTSELAFTGAVDLKIMTLAWAWALCPGAARPWPFESGKSRIGVRETR